MPESNDPRNGPGRPSFRRFDHDHKPKPLRYWVVPLLIAVAIIFFLPRLLAYFE